MPVVQQVSANNGDLKILRRPPGQTQIQGDIARNIHRRETVHVAHYAVELNVAGKIEDRAESELMVRTAAFLVWVPRGIMMDLDLKIAVGRLQSPPIHHLPRRGKFDAIGFACAFVPESEGNQ